MASSFHPGKEAMTDRGNTRFHPHTVENYWTIDVSPPHHQIYLFASDNITIKFK